MDRTLKRYIYRVLVIAAMLLSSSGTARAQLAIEDVRPNDVTPSGFSVVWLTTEPAAPLIEVYSDAAGTNDITSQLEITPYPMQGGDPTIAEEYYSEESVDTLRNISNTLGIIKAGIHGCLPATDYFIRVGADNGSGEIVWWPETGTSQVTTMAANSFVADSRQVLATIVNNAGDPPEGGWANGCVVFAYSSGETIYPISSFVGDGSGPNQVYLNLSRLFDMEGINWTPAGTYGVTLEILGYGEAPIVQTVSIEFTNDFHISNLYQVEINVDGTQDSDGDGIPDSLEEAGCTNYLDADTDDDGLADGVEDADQNGQIDPGETDPCNADTDGDGIQDGTEDGIVDPVPDPDGEGPAVGTDEGEFVPDADPNTTTNPLTADSDGDGVIDGVEDGNRNGLLDSWESDPNDDQSVPAFIVQLKTGFNLVAMHKSGELGDWLPVLGDSDEIEKVMVLDDSTGHLITLIPEDGANPSFVLNGTEGLIVYSIVNRSMGLVGPSCPGVDLKTGTNVIGFGCPPADYSAFDLLNALGSENAISIQRHNTLTGRFESAGFDGTGQAVGVDFPLVPGEGYFINMKQEVSGFEF